MTAAPQYEFLALLFVVIALLELVARRLRLPPAAALILGGAALALLPGMPVLRIDPELVLVVFLPPLLMNGGYLTPWLEFRSNLVAITFLAVGAVIFTTAAVGIACHVFVPGLPWAVCFALGAIVSPPDAVAAAAVLKELSLPGRLTATLEGESLLNDASGLVLFRFAVASALTGVFSAPRAVLSFVILAAGGVALGWLVSRFGLAILRRLRDTELAILTTLLLPVVTYVGGEQVGVSGVLATVTAGIVIGRHQHEVFTAGIRVRAQAFWAVLVFLLESMLFILIGFSLREVLSRFAQLPDGAHALWKPVLAVVLITVAARLVWMYGTWAARRLAYEVKVPGVPRPSLSFATVLGWAGMRGVVTLAAALSLPTELPGRDFVLVSAFAVIIFTVLVQGTTLGPLIRLLRLSGAGELTIRRERADEAWAKVANAQYQAIVELSRQPDGTEQHPRLLEQYARRAALAKEFISDRERHQAIRTEHHAAVLHAIKAGRKELQRLHMEGTLHDEVMRMFEHELDLQQLAAEGRQTPASGQSRRGADV